MTPKGQIIASRASCQLRFHFLVRRIALRRTVLELRDIPRRFVPSFDKWSACRIQARSPASLFTSVLFRNPLRDQRTCSAIPCGTEEPASFDKQPSPYDEGPRLASKLHRALWRAFSAKRKLSCWLGMPAAIDWHLCNPGEARDFDESFAFGTRS